VLDEKALRRSNFREDLQVKLADGQLWWLSRPVIRTGVGDKISCSHGRDYLNLWNGFKEIYQKWTAEPDDSPTAVQNAKLSLIIESLKSNYEISDDDAQDLVMFDMVDSGPGGEREIFETAFATAYGVRPKALATGSSAG
jgi:hypothetical protein